MKLSVLNLGCKVLTQGDEVLRYFDFLSRKELFEAINNGLLSELSENSLIPYSYLKESDDNTFLVVQERIEIITYPSEWTPEALRHAALCTLKVNLVLNKYGLELTDAHPFNVVFDGVRPKFVDLGSFVVKKSKFSWRAEFEFINSFYYPLFLASKGLNIFYRNSFLRNGNSYGDDFLYLSKIFPFFFFIRNLNSFMQFINVAIQFH